MHADLVEKIGTLARAGLDCHTLQIEADNVMSTAIGYPIGVWASVDPATMLFTTCNHVGPVANDPESERRLFEIEYLGADPLTFAEIARRERPAAALTAEIGDPRRAQRFAELHEPLGAGDELRAVFKTGGNGGGRCWGTVAAYRVAGERPFTRADADCFAAISKTMAEGLRLAFLRAATEPRFEIDDPPGVLTMGADGRIANTTGAAQRWLDSISAEPDLPTVLRTLVAGVTVHDEATALVTGSAGPVALHASRMKPDDDVVAVVLERPRPAQLTPRIIDASNLTPRESEIAELVLRGQTTAQIARGVGISDYTVQDHLKSIFRKVGVQTRGELSNELYVRHYLAPKSAGATPSPYGYFLDA